MAGASASGKPARDPEELPYLLDVADVAALLRTTRKAIYAMIERGRLPGVIRLGRRRLVCRDDLLEWLHRSRASSPKEIRR